MINNSDIEEKALIDSLIDRFKNILKLDKFKGLIDQLLNEEYKKAVGELDSKLKLGINLIPQERDLEFLKRYVNDNITQASDEIANNIRQEIQRGILNKETIPELQTRIKHLFKGKQYKTRLKTILRTELLRANNTGTLEGAKQAQSTGIVLHKWLDVTMDDRTSNICKKEHAKYGTPEQAIPLDEPFIVKVDNKTFKEQSSPFHPNCRSVLRIKVIK